MTDRDALLAAVKASPADDLPRLVLADFLDETGEPDRAELIRVQCADPDRSAFSLVVHDSYGEDFHEGPRYPVLWGTPPVPDSLPATAAFAGDWRGLPVGSRISYRRGFVVAYRGTAEGWLDRGDRLCGANPVERADLTTTPPVTVIAQGDVYQRGSERYRFFLVVRWRGRDVEFDEFVPRHDILRAKGERDADRIAADARGRLARSASAAALLARDWPGVAFTLPAGYATPGSTYIPSFEVPTGIAFARDLLADLTAYRHRVLRDLT